MINRRFSFPVLKLDSKQPLIPTNVLLQNTPYINSRALYGFDQLSRVRSIQSDPI